MKQSAFRMTGKPANDLRATEGEHVEAVPIDIDLIDGRRLSVTCDPHGLTRAVTFTAACGAILRAEERLYCVAPGVSESSFPGVENRFTPDEKMDVVRSLNMDAVPSHIALRKIVSAALARMDALERARVLAGEFSKKELAGAVIDAFEWNELDSFAESIHSANQQEVIAAE